MADEGEKATGSNLSNDSMAIVTLTVVVSELVENLARARAFNSEHYDTQLAKLEARLIELGEAQVKVKASTTIVKQVRKSLAEGLGG